MVSYIKRNKLYIFISCFCLILFCFFALKATGLFEIMSRFMFDASYRENFTLAESSVKTNVGLWDVIVQVLSNYPWQFDVTLIFGTSFFQLVIPLLTAVSGVVFYNRRSSIMQMKYFRISGRYGVTLCKDVINESLAMSFSIFMAYMLFYVMAFVVCQGNFNMSVTRDFLKDLFGSQFYANSPYLYYFIEGFVKYFFVPFIYSFFACSCALVFNDRKKIILAPNLYYFGLSIVGFGLDYVIGRYSLYVNPSSIMVVGSLNDINSILIMLTTMIPFFISCLLIYGEIKHVEI